MNTTNMAVLSGFGARKCLGPLGVNSKLPYSSKFGMEYVKKMTFGYKKY